MRMTTDSYKKIDEVAGEWLAQRDSGHWTDEDQGRFEHWLNESPLHRVAYLRIEHIWERSERLKALGAGVPFGVIPRPNGWNLSPFFKQQERAGTRPRPWVRAVAAGIVLTAVLGAAFHFWPSGASYRTPVGGLASVPVSDGSKVTLNTDSEIRV